MRVLFFFAIFVASASAADRPNIVFLFTDDQTTYSLGCYGNKDVVTPNIDGLAAAGVAFDRHYNTTAICMASRANVMTGMFEYKTGCNFEHGPLMRALWEKSYPMLLRKAGYKTAFAGKFGFEVAEAPGRKGRLPENDFDWWGGGPGQTNYATARNKSMARYAEKYPHSTRSYGAFGSDFIRESAKGDAPFCLSISFKAPHRPVTPDPVDDKVYAGKTFEKPANYGREYGAHFSKQSKQGRQYERFESWNYDKDYDGVMAKYHQQVYAVDVAVGMIRKALEESGVAENTVIIFTSDNGFFCGSHGYGSKVLPYEESSRAPLVMVDPRQSKKGLRSGALTGNVDVAATILELAGIPIPANMDGHSLVPLYEDPKASTHEWLPLINVWGPKECHSLSVVTKDYKYIYWSYGGDSFDPCEELYHLSEDPLELTDLFGKPQYEASRDKMRRIYDKAVAGWKKDAVAWNNYRPFGIVFDRSLPWSDKIKRFRKRARSR